MNTNSTITINTGKTTIKIIPDSDNGKAAILQQSSGKTTNFTIINCKDGELGKHITSFLTKNNIVNQNVIKIISNALLHNNKLSIYTNSNHSINATYFCKNGDVYDDYDNEDEFNENCESDITGLYTSDISGDFHGDIVGTMSGDINGDLNGDIVGTMSGDINGDLKVENIGKNKDNIKYIHIRDYNKKTQEYVYFGEGTIPITKLFKSLNKDKYDGVISLETMLPKYNKNESKKDIFVKSYKSLMNIYNMEE